MDDKTSISNFAALVLLLLFGLILMGAALAPVTPLGADQGQSSRQIGEHGAQTRIPSFELIGEATFPTGYRFQDTEVGGLSGITYDPKKNRYHAVSDDRGRTNPARFYTLTIDLQDGRLAPGDIVFTQVTTLRDEKGRAFRKNHIDAEAIAVTTEGMLYIASEGDAKKLVAPFVNGFDPGGHQVRRLPVPEKYLPAPHCGIRNNSAFESVTITPDQRFLYTAVENALLQDGPKAGVGQQSPSRMIKYDLKRGEVVAEYIYMVDATSQASQFFLGRGSNGLAELLVMGEDTLLALERGYSMEKGVEAKIYQACTRGASNVAATFGLLQSGKGGATEKFTPVQKKEVLNIGHLVPALDNLEGMTFGPRLADGRRSLILVSDNNFSDLQRTQFLAFAVADESPF